MSANAAILTSLALTHGSNLKKKKQDRREAKEKDKKRKKGKKQSGKKNRIELKESGKKIQCQDNLNGVN